MGGAASSSWIALLALLLPLLATAAPAASSVCGRGCHCYHLSDGGRAANCSRLDPATLNKHHAQTTADLRSLRVLPGAAGLASFLEQRLSQFSRHLEELDLADNEAAGAHLRPLRALRRLRLLDLSFCDISDPYEVAALVKHSENLETLRLGGNSLSSLPPLVSVSLVELDLSDCGVSIVRVDSFSHLVSLHRLNLARNRLTHLAADLPPSLKFLDLSDNALIHLPLKLVVNLRRVDISGNPLHCTCSLLRLRSSLSGDHVVVANGPACEAPLQMLHLSLVKARHVCGDRLGVGSRDATRQRRQADPLDLIEGSGAGDGAELYDDTEPSTYEDPDDTDDGDYYDETEVDNPETDGATSPETDGKSPAVQDSVAHEGVTKDISGGSASSTTARPSALEANSTLSLEDDIYEPTVPPPVPAAVDDAATAVVSPGETPPESGPPAAAVVKENDADSSVDEGPVTDDVELSEHEDEPESGANGSVASTADNVWKDEETNATKAENDYDENEVMGSDDGLDGGTIGTEEQYDYDYDVTEEPEDNIMESETSNIAESETSVDANENADDMTIDSTKEEGSDVAQKSFETESAVVTSDKNYGVNETGFEETANGIENTADVMRAPDRAAAANTNETLSTTVDTGHAGPHKDIEENGMDAKLIEEVEGSGESDDDEALPVGPLTGFLDTNSQDAAPTTTTAPDEGMLVIDDDEPEGDEKNLPLIPPGVDETSETAPTDDNGVKELVVKSEISSVLSAIPPDAVANDTDIQDNEDGEEGSGVPIIVGSEDWEGEEGLANETEKTLEMASEEPFEIDEDIVIPHHVIPVEHGQEASSSSTTEAPSPTSTSEKPGPVVHDGLLRFNIAGNESNAATQAPQGTESPVAAGSGREFSSSASPDTEQAVSVGGAKTEDKDEGVTTGGPVPMAGVVPAVTPSEGTALSPEEPPMLSSESPVLLAHPDIDLDVVAAVPAPGAEDEDDGLEVETVMPTGDVPANDTARVVLAEEGESKETPLNSAGSYVVLGIIMALVVFLLGYAVMRSRRGRRRAAAKAAGKDTEAGSQQEGRELKEISKPLLGVPSVPAANGKGDHMQPLVTKPTDNPDLKDDDADESLTEKPLLEPSPRSNVYESLNGGEKEHVPVHPASPKKSPMVVRGIDAADAPPVPEKRRALSRLPAAMPDGGPNMYGADGLPGEVVQPAVNGDATPPVNGLSTFAAPVSPTSGRVKVVAREDPDSVPKKPVFVMNQGPGAASGVV